MKPTENLHTDSGAKNEIISEVQTSATDQQLMCVCRFQHVHVFTVCSYWTEQTADWTDLQSVKLIQRLLYLWDSQLFQLLQLLFYVQL